MNLKKHGWPGSVSWAEVKLIPGVAFGLTFERIEDWEYGDYGERYGLDVYTDIVAYFLCWRFAVRYWHE